MSALGPGKTLHRADCEMAAANSLVEPDTRRPRVQNVNELVTVLQLPTQWSGDQEVVLYGNRLIADHDRRKHTGALLDRAAGPPNRNERPTHRAAGETSPDVSCSVDASCRQKARVDICE